MIKVNKFLKLSHYFHTHKMENIARAVYHFTRLIYSCDISYKADISPSVVFAHQGLGVVIGFDAHIGSNTKILNNVTIGGRADHVGNNGRCNPYIGDNVLIGSGACIIGPVTIGDNVQIGANAVVITDIPENTIAVGVPAKVK